MTLDELRALVAAGESEHLARIIRNPKRKRGNPGMLLAYASGCDARRFG
jgi:hypothetical protein